MSEFSTAVRLLSETQVEFIIVGGVAATLHGAARITYDIDIVYSRKPANMERLVRALAGQRPYLRGATPGLPFRFDAETLRRGLNFTLTTDVGDIDLLGEIAGGGSYEDLLPRTQLVDLFGFACRVVTLPALIALKRAAGRGKDLDALAELEALLEERDG